jgi:malonate-semialdehyde dehydrogenase (acetylating)/methylmalonate-semialdehyde dehydrogenase
MTVRKLRNYVNGEWFEPRGCKWLDVENPSTGEILAQVPLSSTEDTNNAIAVAKAAFPSWAATPVDKRVAPLFKLANRVRDNHETIARCIVEEMGKSLPDAAPGIDGEVIRLPIGVFAMISPFNFPAMVPFWFLPYALATGNTFIVKPSKQVPCTMQLMAGYINDSGFPKGVFNMVCGDRVIADAFMDSPDIAGVSVVGSTPICRIIAERCAKTNKRFQGMGAAKNHLVVMPDAKMDDVTRNMVTSGYGCAGQRCMASSAIVCVGQKTYEDTTKRFIEASRKVITTNPLDPKVANEPMVMGPVISAKAKEFILSMIETGVKEGATLALDGRSIRVPGCEKGHFVGTTVFTDVTPGMNIHQTEIFGPVQVILKVDTLDEAIRIINDHQYGNGASIYTQNGYYARKFKLETEAGMIGVNVGIPAPVAYLPFGGMKSSQFADIKAQGKAIVNFFTEDKIITERFWPEA